MITEIILSGSVNW